MRRSKAANGRRRERRRERRAERADRACGECTACSERECLWLRGFGGKGDRPDKSGVRLVRERVHPFRVPDRRAGRAGRSVELQRRVVYAAPVERVAPYPTEEEYAALLRLGRSSGECPVNVLWDTGRQDPEGRGLWAWLFPGKGYEEFVRRCAAAGRRQFEWGVTAA